MLTLHRAKYSPPPPPLWAAVQRIVRRLTALPSPPAPPPEPVYVQWSPRQEARAGLIFFPPPQGYYILTLNPPTGASQTAIGAFIAHELGHLAQRHIPMLAEARRLGAAARYAAWFYLADYEANRQIADWGLSAESEAIVRLTGMPAPYSAAWAARVAALLDAVQPSLRGREQSLMGQVAAGAAAALERSAA
jgi:hypothetical protein